MPTIRPFTSPSRPPTTSPAANTAMIGMSGIAMNSLPVMYAVSPRTDPTERSTLRVMITTA